MVAGAGTGPPGAAGVVGTVAGRGVAGAGVGGVGAAAGATGARKVGTTTGSPGVGGAMRIGPPWAHAVPATSVRLRIRLTAEKALIRDHPFNWAGRGRNRQKRKRHRAGQQQNGDHKKQDGDNTAHRRLSRPRAGSVAGYDPGAP